MADNEANVAIPTIEVEGEAAKPATPPVAAEEKVENSTAVLDDVARPHDSAIGLRNGAEGTGDEKTAAPTPADAVVRLPSLRDSSGSLLQPYIPSTSWEGPDQEVKWYVRVGSEGPPELSRYYRDPTPPAPPPPEPALQSSSDAGPTPVEPGVSTSSTSSPPPPPPPGDDLYGLPPSVEIVREDRARLHSLVSEVRKTNFQHFKNWYGDDDRNHIVQVLVGGSSIKKEADNEYSRRRNRKTSILEMRASDGKEAPQDSASWIQRVRLHSPCVLGHLAKVGARDFKEPWKAKTFFRPFKYLIHYHPQMKEALKTLEEKWSDCVKGSCSHNPADPERAEKADEDSAGSGDAVADDTTAKDEETHADQAVSKEQSESDAEVEPADEEPGKTKEDKNAEEGESDANKKDVDKNTDKDDADKDAEEKDSSEEPEPDLDTLYMDSRVALCHMRTYCKFIEEEIIPLSTRFEGATTGKIMFSDLWYLFREGHLVYSPTSAALPAYQSFWRVYSIVPTGFSPDIDPAMASESTSDEFDCDDNYYSTDSTQFVIWCYYIDYDGERYGAVKHYHKIKMFPGDKDIRELPVYPVRFLADAKAVEGEQMATGRAFQAYVQQKHLYCLGWTLTHTPTGDEIEDVKRHSEHVDSEIIVDFVEAFQIISSWKPKYYRPFNCWVDQWPSDNADLAILEWKTAATFTEHQEAIIRFDEVSLKRRNEWLEKDHFLVDLKRGDVTSVREEDAVLLPKRLIAYVLRERKFVHVDIGSMKSIKPQDNIFENLKIPISHKKMVLSLIHAHFRKSKKRDITKHRAVEEQADSHVTSARSQDGTSANGEARTPAVSRSASRSRAEDFKKKDLINQDLIRGKGNGLILLLHGVPGVGKTATAEAVAQANKKPLFPITCGDLGTSPSGVESKLSGIFRLAHRWDCVLLLDEADVFLAQRAPSDLERNALVSVFLRVLEYYSGILFLTTNRVGVLDEAFKSRIHMSLYYPPLDYHQTMEIFEMNISRLAQIEHAREADGGDPALHIEHDSIMAFARWYYLSRERTPGRWNGRQIRNAFQIAASLAHFDVLESAVDALGRGSVGGDAGIDDNGARRELTNAQFETVADAIDEFNNYLAEARHGTDSDLVALDQTRADGYVPGASLRRTVGTTPLSRRFVSPWLRQDHPRMSQEAIDHEYMQKVRRGAGPAASGPGGGGDGGGGGGPGSGSSVGDSVGGSGAGRYHEPGLGGGLPRGGMYSQADIDREYERRVGPLPHRGYGGPSPSSGYGGGHAREDSGMGAGGGGGGGRYGADPSHLGPGYGPPGGHYAADDDRGGHPGHGYMGDPRTPTRSPLGTMQESSERRGEGQGWDRGGGYGYR